jgi:hypothetical protein
MNLRLLAGKLVFWLIGSALSYLALLWAQNWLAWKWGIVVVSLVFGFFVGSFLRLRAEKE